MTAIQNALCWMLVAALVTSSAQAQIWTPQNSGTTDPLYAVHFSNATCGWAVGGASTGNVFHTTDGGTTWTAQSVNGPFSGQCYAVTSTDTLTAWLSGGNWVAYASIQHTTDGGDNWNPQTNGVSNTMKALVFVDSVNGWAAGGTTQNAVILHTTDAGSSWTAQVTGTVHTLFGLAFPDDHSGWAVGRGAGILYTTDAGTSWDTQDAGITSDLFGLAFRDSLNGWAVGAQGRIVHTTDGGNTWNGQNSGAIASLNGVATCRTCGHEVWAVGDSGVVLHTTDDGANWTRQTSGITPGITAVTFLNSTTGWAVARDGSILRYSADTTNTPPGAFTRLLPVDGDTLIVGTNTGDSVRFAWSTSHDSDGDPITYILRVDSVPIMHPDTFVTSDTSVYVHIPVPVFRLDDIVSVYWSVIATDGRDSTEASNHEGRFTLDIRWENTNNSPVAIVKEYSLTSYPNPFNPTTTLRFGVPKASQVTLDIFDILGRKTETLFSGMTQAGEHSVIWNCPSCPSGMYVVRMQAGGQTMQQKLLLLK